jgi:hypothetical protein
MPRIGVSATARSDAARDRVQEISGAGARMSLAPRAKPTNRAQKTGVLMARALMLRDSHKTS